MSTLLLIVMIAAGIVMSLTILLMAPKGGLGFGLGGAAGSNEYGTKKSIETSLKKIATYSSIIFVVCALIYPFLQPKTFDPTTTTGTGSVAPTFDFGGAGTGEEVAPGTGQ
ncbi:MAG TPA: preprotein translocase subunit SecG [Candidatus Absconditabacterales bacterium]|nr:preprotein translocase subunit SecG [Candidatus Absconditabacterales bacterium]HNG97386.1 preprotein translocase subunit SecG [Candidatus Absconditabacterales bacterium]